jgi:hypothetical protein
MEKTRVGSEYRADVAESVQLLIQQFYQEENRIAHLEAGLHQLRGKHEDLRQELAPYRITASSTTPTLHVGHPVDQKHNGRSVPPIHRCPDEVLYLIFEQCVTPSYYHRFIRRLLLVCKRWYDIVINRAKLWAQVEIVSWDLFDFSIPNSQLPYISTCMVRSKDVPMEATVDLSDFCDSGYIVEALIRYARTITDKEEQGVIVGTIVDQE